MKNGNSHKGYVIKRIGPDNITDMEILHKAVYGRRAKAGYYEKKFSTGYTGVEYTCLIVYNREGKSVASLCLVPCFITYENRRILAGQLTDGMTDPEERKNGLFSMLMNEIIELAKHTGIQLIIGFSNQDAGPLFVKMGWQEMKNMDRFVIPVEYSLPAFIVSLIRRSRNWYQKFQRINSQSREALFENSVLKEGFAGFERSREYVLYKFFEPTEILVKGNSKAWIKKGHDLFIGDMEIAENNLDDMIKEIQKVARNIKAGKIYFQCSPGTKLHQLFSQYYEAIPSFPVVFKDLGADIQPDKLRFTFSDVDIF